MDNIDALKQQLQAADKDWEKTIISVEIVKVISEAREASSDPHSVHMVLYNIPDFTLQDAVLHGADLDHAKLEGINLHGADLTGAILNWADLSGANLSWAYLIHTELNHAYMVGANLSDALLTHAQLRRADLSGANLKDAYLVHAIMNVANLQGADLSGAILHSAILTGANLTGANLTGTNLIGANLTGAILEGANIEDAILEGVAYEIHNAFSEFQSKETEYLALINQPDFEGEDIIDNIYDPILDNIYDQFNDNIHQLFQGDDLNIKLEQFNIVFEKSKESLSDPRYKQLVYKSVRFAFSQDEDFKREYIKTFLDETCNAYSGSGDNTSCVKGIMERYVLSVGVAVQIICSDGCSNETYKKLDKLMNPKFNIAEAASTWWETEAIKEDIKAMDKEGRKANFIEYLMAEANRLNSENAQTAAEIENYANDIDYAFTELALGGGSKVNHRVRRSNKRSRGGLRKGTRRNPKKKSRKVVKTRASRKSRKSK